MLSVLLPALFVGTATALTPRPVIAVFADPAGHAVVADSVPSDSIPLLTTDALAQMTKFWAAIMKEPADVHDAGRRRYQKKLTLPLDFGALGERFVDLPSVADMPPLAAQYPSVAADLKAAGLTAQQWERYRAALLSALFTVQLTRAENVTPLVTSPIGKNIAFLVGHLKEFEALKATRMWLPQVQLKDGAPGSNLGP